MLRSFFFAKPPKFHRSAAFRCPDKQRLEHTQLVLCQVEVVVSTPAPWLRQIPARGPAKTHWIRQRQDDSLDLVCNYGFDFNHIVLEHSFSAWVLSFWISSSPLLHQRVTCVFPLWRRCFPLWFHQSLVVFVWWSSCAGVFVVVFVWKKKNKKNSLVCSFCWFGLFAKHAFSPAAFVVSCCTA